MTEDILYLLIDMCVSETDELQTFISSVDEVGKNNRLFHIRLTLLDCKTVISV